MESKKSRNSRKPRREREGAVQAKFDMSADLMVFLFFFPGEK